MLPGPYFDTHKTCRNSQTAWPAVNVSVAVLVVFRVDRSRLLHLSDTTLTTLDGATETSVNTGTITVSVAEPSALVTRSAAT